MTCTPDCVRAGGLVLMTQRERNRIPSYH